MQQFYSSISNFKKVLLLLVLAEFIGLSASANPGDTTWVTIFNLRKLTYHGAYDTTAAFPTGKRYRKIRMHYILGRYACPATEQYCGSWDYTTEVRAWPAGKDSVEIARVITPYATDWLSLGKKHDYIVDVTDYATALQGSTAMRYFYDGYSWGFTLTLKLEIIEGVPPMDALSVKNIYDGYYTYGAAPTATNNIENYLSAKTFSYSAPVTRPFIKNTVSGHGSDNPQTGGCAEFCSKYYQLKLNNTMVSQKQLWRSTCGSNEVYPQTGTWIYERANWCPGEVVHPIYHDISALTTAGSTFSVDVDMEPYTVANPSAGYNWVSHMINYSAPNHTLDVSIEDIIAPTKDDNYLRENPTCANPVIRLKNTGTQTVTSVVFSYGLAGHTPDTYTWTPDSAFNFLDETMVVFPQMSTLLTGTASNTFSVSVLSVNGSADQNSFNNTYSSITPTVTIFPKTLFPDNQFIIRMATNHSTDQITGNNETTWTLTDAVGDTVATGAGASGTTIDVTIDIPNSGGCYKLSINDSGCDGMSFWANTAGGVGTLQLMKSNGVNSFFSAPGDFGCGYTKYFTIPVLDVGIKQNSVNNNKVSVYPNPATNTANIRFDLEQSQNVNYRLLDITGKEMIKKTINKVTSHQSETIDLSQIGNGIYLLSVEPENGAAITKKIVIQK